MPKGKPEVRWRKKFTIIEAGDKKFPMTANLYKSRLVIEDEDGNSVAVDKREGRIALERNGNVEWHREK
jgi:hypothetical protein